jgi:hypothetical protein
MIAITALGLAAALLFALSAFIQQRAARTAVGADTASLRDASGVKRLFGAEGDLRNVDHAPEADVRRRAVLRLR